MKSIFLAVPHYGQFVPDALPGLNFASAEHRVLLNSNGGSLLAFNFNCLWCAALNRRSERYLTHFAMMHSDIAAPAGWLDVLLAEMERVGADVLSAVIPIKDVRGLTSTGVLDAATRHIRRFTMKEIFALPETFDAGAAGYPQQRLLVNTGLWVCRFTEPWVEEFPGFEIQDRIVRTDAGRFIANVLPEDWNFSDWCARRDLRVFATRKVPVQHFGNAAYQNNEPWGEWDKDQGDQR